MTTAASDALSHALFGKRKRVGGPRHFHPKRGAKPVENPRCNNTKKSSRTELCSLLSIRASERSQKVQSGIYNIMKLHDNYIFSQLHKTPESPLIPASSEGAMRTDNDADPT
jgi:hypothetical protein